MVQNKCQIGCDIVHVDVRLLFLFNKSETIVNNCKQFKNNSLYQALQRDVTICSSAVWTWVGTSRWVLGF